MKLSNYRIRLALFIAVLLPHAVPAGQHDTKRVALTTDGDNPGLRLKIEEQDQTQVPEQRQRGEPVIRFIRDPDPAPEFAVKGIDGPR